MFTGRCARNWQLNLIQLDRLRISRAPGRLDVMGGIAADTGALALQSTLACGSATALQQRDDRALRLFSFNLLDAHLPFTFQMPIDALATVPLETLRREFQEPGRRWASFLAGCLFILHDEKLVDLTDPRRKGLTLATFSTIPENAAAGASAAGQVSAMMNFIEQFDLRDGVDPFVNCNAYPKGLPARGSRAGKCY